MLAMIRILSWLLVALLPLVGFWVGSRLTPELKPVWEVSFGLKTMVYLGLVDEGRTVLMMERSSWVLEDDSLEALVGINTADGKETFRSPLPDELRNKLGITTLLCHLSADGNTVLLIDRNKKEVLLFDRKKQQVVQRYAREPQAPSHSIGRAMLRGTTLIVSGSNVSMSQENSLEIDAVVTIWDTSSTTPRHTIPAGSEAFLEHLSDDGRFAHVNINTQGMRSHAIIDTVQGKIIFTINSSIQDVKWSKDYQSLSVLRRDDDDDILDTYRRQGDQFTLTASIRNPPTGSEQAPVSPWLALTRKTRHHSRRLLIGYVLGESILSLVNRLWPPELVTTVYAVGTGEMVRSLVIPDKLENEYLAVNFFPDAPLKGVFHPQYYSLAYWSFTSVPAWPKFLGLFIGLALATLLARRNLRKRTSRDRLARVEGSIV